jgi:hypothetical protein
LGFLDNINNAIGNATGYNPGNGQFNLGTLPNPLVQSGDIAGIKTPSIDGINVADPVNDPNLRRGLDPSFKGNAKDNPPGPAGPLSQADQLKNKQLGIADQLSDPNGLQSSLYQQFRNQRIKDLASDQLSTRHNLSQRGLLYGPGSKGIQLSNVAQAGSDLAKAKGQIRTESQNQADQIRATVLDQGIKQMQTQQQLYDTIYGDALTQYNNERQAYQAVGAGVGAIAGTYFGPAGTAAGAVAGGAIAG